MSEPMPEPMTTLSPQKLNSAPAAIPNEPDDVDMTFHDPPSSPFVSHIEDQDQENIAPDAPATATPVKPLVDPDDNAPQSAFKVPLEKKPGLKERNSPAKMSPAKRMLDDFEDLSSKPASPAHTVPRKRSPVTSAAVERPESVMANGSRKSQSPAKSPLGASLGSKQRTRELAAYTHDLPPPEMHPASSPKEPALRDNEGLTVAMKLMQEARSESHESSSTHHSGAAAEIDTRIEDTDFNPDGPELSSLDADDTCFSTFSEMPGVDMTKFASFRKSPTKGGLPDQATPRAHAQTTPSTVRRAQRTPSPTPRRAHKENDTTNLLLDFTAQIEAFSQSRRGSPSRGRTSPSKYTTEPNLLSYIQNQRSPAKGASSHTPSTPSQNRQLLNLLDFELPPPPTPRSVPTVTIRELESLKSNFQSQISSLSASLSGKEAQVESLVKAVADAERRVGQSQEIVRDERSSREYAEAQMEDWKKKGEEVQKLLQDVQSELARNDTEREQLLVRLNEAEKRTEEAENRSAELETKLIEAESKNVDMTTFINPDEGGENRKVYSEIECQTAIAEKVNEVARDLHSAYKAKHEKKIKALKENYQKKADERCKELRVQIIRLERQVEDAEKKRDDTFSKVLPESVDSTSDAEAKPRNSPPASLPEDLKTIEAQKSEIEHLKAKLAGLESELMSLRKSQETLRQDLEAERVEKGELVAAAEQMLSLCGERMGGMQQEGELGESHVGGDSSSNPPAEHAMRHSGSSTGDSNIANSNKPARPGVGLAGGRPGSAMGDRLGAMNERSGGSGIAKPSGLRAPGGFGFQGGGGPGLSRSTSGGKSRILSNIEKMGGGRNANQGQD